MITILAILVVLLVVFDKPIASGAVSAGKYLYSRLPTVGSPLGIFTAKVELPVWKVVALIGLFWFVSGGVAFPGWTIPSLPGIPRLSPAVTAATYVYEKDEGGIPNEVQTGLDRLNREKKILATPFEQDTKDGAGEVPDRYKVPLEAAKKVGLPSLVATAGAKVVRVVKNPTTEAAVMEAAK